MDEQKEKTKGTVMVVKSYFNGTKPLSDILEEIAVEMLRKSKDQTLKANVNIN